MTSSRDYIAEMDAIIEARTKGDNWVPALVAEEIIESADHSLLDGWLRQMAADMLTAVIAKRERSTRAVTRARAGARTFEKARADAASGKSMAAMSSFAMTYVIDAKNTRRKVADMTGADHEFVAMGCERDAKSIKLLAEFHRQVAVKVGMGKTGDALTETQYDRLYQSIVKAPALASVAS